MGCKSSKCKGSGTKSVINDTKRQQTPRECNLDSKAKMTNSVVSDAHRGDKFRNASLPSGKKENILTEEFDTEGNPLVLPEGLWVRTEGTPFYYSEKENLYYHPPSCQFYDPTNEMWYDPEKDEWYNDDEEA